MNQLTTVTNELVKRQCWILMWIAKAWKSLRKLSRKSCFPVAEKNNFEARKMLVIKLILICRRIYMIQDFKASGKEKRGRLLLLIFFVCLEEEKFRKPSLTSPLLRTEFDTQLRKFYSKKFVKYKKFIVKYIKKWRQDNSSTYRRTDAQYLERANWVSGFR